MTQEEIYNGNKLIVEFLEWEKLDNVYRKTEIYENKLVVDNFISPENMKFHSSWDWLMPVVIKIESFEYNGYLCKYLEATKFEENWYVEGDFFVILFNDIDELYVKVMKFIKWYNENNNSNTLNNPIKIKLEDLIIKVGKSNTFSFNSSFKKLGFDSLDCVKLILLVESEFCIFIDDSTTEYINTPEKLYKTIINLKNK